MPSEIIAPGSSYYNEIDPQKAAWLRELIRRGLIAPGYVDERSIADVQPADLVGYAQCHFFAGIGLWSYALRLAGWPDDRHVWTGSCPCPSFSVAGKGEGFDDARHLWPAWYRLIRECRPRIVFGEQADGAIGHGWLDLVQRDMEAESYALAAAVLGAHSAGAPHIRQRLYFVGADTADLGHDGRRSGEAGDGIEAFIGRRSECEPERLRDVGSGSHAADARRDHAGQHGRGRALLPARPEQCGGSERGSIPLHSERWPQLFDGPDGRDGQDAGRDQAHGIAGTRGEVLGSGDTAQRGQPMRGCTPGNSGHAALTGESGRSDNAISPRLEGHFGDVREWRGPGWLDPLTARSVAEAGATRGFWRDCDWWYGRDGKYRPAGPGIFPLAHGATDRVVRLRGYGDAINVYTAKAFIEAAMSTIDAGATDAQDNRR